MASTETPKKNRWSNMFKKKDKSDGLLPTVPNTDHTASQPQPYPNGPSNSSQNNQSFQGNPVDSAYASSEPPSVHGDSNIVPVENNGRFNNVASDRNLALNKSTGDVLDKDTGEVVSTVTTTTTTTTTTTLKKNKNGETVVDVQTKPAGETSTSRPQEVVEPAAGIVEAPADNAVPASQVRHDNAPPQQRRSPVIPPRSPHRASRELDSMQHAPPNPSTAGYNFSHPQRANPRQSGDWTQPPTAQPSGMPVNYAQPSSRSTMESLRSLAKEQTSSETYTNLKAAAKGLHGVGETLRGVINNELETKLVPDHSGSAAAYQKNQAVIERGRQEMQMGRIQENRDSWNSAGGPANVPGYGNQMVSPIEPQTNQWQERTPSRSSSQKRGLRKLIKKKKSG